MKKLILLFIATVMSGVAVGQSQEAPEKLNESETLREDAHQTFDKFQNEIQPGKLRKKSEHDGWYNYSSALSAGNQDATQTVATPVHPDTLLRIFSSGETAPVRYHSAGQSLDPRSEFFQATEVPMLRSHHNFSLDSIRFPFIYNRPNDSFLQVETGTVEDTLYDFTVNGGYSDTLTYVMNETYTKELTHEFFVNGMYMDSIAYINDTAWYINNATNDTTGHIAPWTITYTDGRPDETVWPAYDLDTSGSQADTLNRTPDNSMVNEAIVYDSTAMDSFFVEVYLDDTTGMPQVDSSFTAWPDYNIRYDTINDHYDTNYLTADGGLKNSMNFYSYEDTLVSERKEVVDTMFVQVLFPGNGLNRLEFNNGVNFATPSINRNTHRAGEPYQEYAVELTEEDTTGENFSSFVQGIGVDLRGGAILGLAVTFKSGDPNGPASTDTLFDASSGSAVYKSNAISLIRSIHQTSFQDTTFNNSYAYYTFSNVSQKFHPDRIMNDDQLPDYLHDYFYPFTNSSDQNETPHFSMSFHLSAENLSAENAESPGDKVQSVYPNPASVNDNVAVEVKTDRQEAVSMRLYNAIGKEVKNVPAQTLSKGTHDVEFSTSGLKPGVYFLNVNVGGQQQTVKLSITQ